MRPPSRVVQRSAQFFHRGIEAIVELDIGISGPQTLAQLLACHHLARPLEQNGKHLEWLALNFDARAMLAQFSAAQVYFIYPEPVERRSLCWRDHVVAAPFPRGTASLASRVCALQGVAWPGQVREYVPFFHRLGRTARFQRQFC